MEGNGTTTLTLTLHHDTLQVSIGGDQMPVALAQMIAGEAMRQLDQIRRIAAAQGLQVAAVEQQRLRDLMARTAGRG